MAACKPAGVLVMSTAAGDGDAAYTGNPGARIARAKAVGTIARASKDLDLNHVCCSHFSYRHPGKRGSMVHRRLTPRPMLRK
jgi:hypothetical protein